MSIRNIIIALIVLINFIVFYGTWLKEQRMGGALPQKLSSAPVPDFSWTDFDGHVHNIKELAGHTVVLHFWATWCGPCRREFPELLKEAKALKDDNIIFLTISGDDSKEEAQKFISNAQWVSGAKEVPDVLYAFDPQKQISFDIFQTDVYPESIVIDKNQNMLHKFAGTVNWQNEEVVKLLNGI